MWRRQKPERIVNTPKKCLWKRQSWRQENSIINGLCFICLVLYSILLRLVFSSSIHLEPSCHSSNLWVWTIGSQFLGGFTLLSSLIPYLSSVYSINISFSFGGFIGITIFLSHYFHHWFRDLLRELDKKYEVLLIIFFLVFLLFLVSEGLLFVSFFWTSFHSQHFPVSYLFGPLFFLYFYLIIIRIL